MENIKRDATRSGQLAFMPHVQGMRAVAIMAVVACHAGFPGFEGGYIGVDMFFVISSYLISGLLVKEMAANNKVDLVRFYARRCKRLFPALLLVMLATLLFASVILAPFEQIAQLEAALYVPLWLSNFYFSFADFDYFSPEAASNLFLHTWSLGVEEQFYLLWPILVVGLVKQRIFQAQNGLTHWSDLEKGLVLIIVASFLLCLFWSFSAPLLAFYLMPARVWQFALGGLVFLLAHRGVSAFGFARLIAARPHSARLAAGLLGLLLIGVSVVFLNEDTVYPGVLALFPAAGTALLLFCGTLGTQNAITKLLGTTWMQKIGDISYSWYLWHWPVLILGNIVFAPLWGGIALQCALVVISLLLAMLTYWLVEVPARHSRVLMRKPLLTVGFSIVILSSAVVLVDRTADIAKEQAISPEQLQYLQIKRNLPALYQAGCDEWYTNSRVIACSYGDQNAENTAVLIGDSIGAQWFSALVGSLVESGWRFIIYTKSACPIVNEPVYYQRIGMLYEVCAQWRHDALAAIVDLSPDLVFMGSSTTYEYSVAQWTSGTASVLAQLAPAASAIYVIRGTHQLPFDGPACLARKHWQPEFLSAMSPCSMQAESDIDMKVLQGLQAAIIDFPNAHLLDLNSIVCPQQTCVAQNNEQIVFRDQAHLADAFVAGVAPEVQARIKATRSGQDFSSN